MILQALASYYDHVAANDPAGISPFGYSEQSISFEAVLNTDGAVVNIVDLRIPDGKMFRPSLLQTPQPPKRAGRNPPPCFLWDKTGYVFGVEADESGERPFVENREYHKAFHAYHAEALAGTCDEGLQAVLAFLKSWEPSNYPSLSHAEAMLNTNLAFRLEGDSVYIHQRPAARHIWEQMLAAAETERGECLLTGRQAPIARLHPSIKGVPGAQPSGASIVSFNLNAFTSYGKEQGANAPVSQASVFAYTTALNMLLSRTHMISGNGKIAYKNRAQIGETTTVFWAEADSASRASAADDFIASLFTPREEANGGDGALASLGLPPEMKVFLLGLSPNAARISVRFWYDGTLSELTSRFERCWRDLEIGPSIRKTAPSIWAILNEIAAQGKTGNIPPNLPAEIMRAILTGRPYPHSLLTLAIMRCRTDRRVNSLRASILKACLIRSEKENVPVSLDQGAANPGYLLGRLFALLEGAQRTAFSGLNATVGDRFYGVASSSPGVVFPLFLRNANHHLTALRRGGKPALAAWFEKEIGQIIVGLDGAFPKALRLEDQGRFAIGYYQQRYDRKADAPAGLADGQDINQAA